MDQVIEALPILLWCVVTALNVAAAYQEWVRLDAPAILVMATLQGLAGIALGLDLAMLTST